MKNKKFQLFWILYVFEDFLFIILDNLSRIKIVSRAKILVYAAFLSGHKVSTQPDYKSARKKRFNENERAWVCTQNIYMKIFIFWQINIILIISVSHDWQPHKLDGLQNIFGGDQVLKNAAQRIECLHNKI